MTGFFTDPVLGPCFLVDYSSLEPITTCPYRAYLTLERKKRLNVEQAALRFGKHIHTALDYRYKMQFYRGLTSTYDFISPDRQVTVEEMQNRILERCFTSTPCESEFWRNLDSASKVIEMYNATYSGDDFKVASVGGRPFVEQSFSIITEKIDGILIIYIGRIDLALYNSREQLFVLDHKTTSMLGEQFWADQAMSGQYKGYCWAIEKAGLPRPTGYIVNALACRKPTKTGVPIEFERRTFFLNDDSLSLWYQNMLLQVETYLWHHKRNKFPQHTKHCVTKYGLCEFYKCCEQHPNSHDDCLESNLYTTNDWSPLK